MTAEVRRARGRFSPALLLVVGVCVAILAGLGTWQLQRLAWKERLLARIEALKAAPAEPLTVVLHRLADRVDVEYVRVQAACPQLEHLPTIRLYAVREGVIGNRIIAACPIAVTPYGSILVDRGFIPREGADVHPTPSDLHEPIVGVLRKGDPGNAFTPKNDPANDRWYLRDVPAMAAVLHAEAPAPVFLMLESPAPTGHGPHPAPLPADIPNRHLEYALTWYGLALALLGVYIAKLLRDRKA